MTATFMPIAGLGGVIADVSLYAEENVVALALIKGWLKHAKTVYIWKGIPKSVILPFGGHRAQALHIKVCLLLVTCRSRSLAVYVLYWLCHTGASWARSPRIFCRRLDLAWCGHG
jgi:hypothetical protein